jgi:hypothetical protein
VPIAQAALLGQMTNDSGFSVRPVTPATFCYWVPRLHKRNVTKPSFFMIRLANAEKERLCGILTAGEDATRSGCVVTFDFSNPDRG